MATTHSSAGGRRSVGPATAFAALLLISLPHLCEAATEVTVTGLLVDKYCWDDRNGIALDTGANLKLYPTRHTVHCLVEVGICKNSGFVIVQKAEGSEEYAVAYELDEAGNAKAVELMLQVPVGAERWEEKGYEITVTGTHEGATLLTTDPTTMTGRIPSSEDEPPSLPPPPPSAAGGEVTVTGLLVDLYCWDTLNGIALDTGEDLTRFPTRHTVHCLVEVGVCKNSGFVIVEPDPSTSGSNLRYRVAYTLDAAGNQKAIELMEEVDAANRNDQTGYEVTVSGTVSPGSNILAVDPATMTGGLPGATGSDSGAPAGGLGKAVSLLSITFASCVALLGALL